MKNRTTTLIVALTLGVCALAPAQTGQSTTQNNRAEQASTLYQQGLVAMGEGKYDIAASLFREVIRLYPKHTQARRHLLHILNNRKTLEITKRKAALKKITIPSVDLDKATVQEALQVLSTIVERESKKTVTPNFIVQDPTNTFASSSVTLKLNRIPAETLLNYIVDQANARVRYDNHAIVISPRNPKKTGTNQQAAPSISIP